MRTKEQVREKHREYMRMYRLAHPERASKAREGARRYRAANLEQARERVREWRAANKEKEREARLAAYAANPERRRAASSKYAAAHPEKLRERNREYRAANREKVRGWSRKCYAASPERARENARAWKATNPEKAREISRMHAAKRRAAELRRTVSWADLDAIRRIYAACPGAHHVDHIYPLQGRLISGLHVHYNLSYLPGPENSAKGNKLPSPELVAQLDARRDVCL